MADTLSVVKDDANVIYGNSSDASVASVASAVSIIGDMKIYLDGTEITEAQLKELNPDTIASIEVNKETHALKVTSKKGK